MGTVVSDALKNEPKLWAGKFKTVEELEAGYKNSFAVFNENKELNDKLKNLTHVPDDYDLPTDIVLREDDLKEIKAIAKSAGLNQEQCVRVAKEMQARIDHQVNSFDAAKKAIPEDTMNVLEDYVNRFYPERVREAVLNKLIKDKDAMSDALKHRDSILNTSAPGMDKGGGAVTPKYDGEKELSDAAKAYHKNPRDNVAKKRYLDLARDVGNARYGKK